MRNLHTSLARLGVGWSRRTIGWSTVRMNTPTDVPENGGHTRRLPASLLAVGLALLATPALAAESSQNPELPAKSAIKWTVQVDPLTTALGFAHIQVERALSEHLAIYVGPSLRLYSSVFDAEPSPFVGIGVELGVRWFLRPTAPRGLWAQVRGVLARLSTDEQGGKTGIGGYGSALVGHTWIFAGRWVLAAGAGVNYLRYTIAGMGTEGLLPAAHTAVGVAF